jgi:hypothetical protein
MSFDGLPRIGTAKEQESADLLGCSILISFVFERCSYSWCETGQFRDGCDASCDRADEGVAV